MLDCEGSLNSVELIRSLSEMEPSGVSVEVTKSCTNKDHCQSAQQCGSTTRHFRAVCPQRFPHIGATSTVRVIHFSTQGGLATFIQVPGTGGAPREGGEGGRGDGGRHGRLRHPLQAPAAPCPPGRAPGGPLGRTVRAGRHFRKMLFLGRFWRTRRDSWVFGRRGTRGRAFGTFLALRDEHISRGLESRGLSHA